MDTEDVGSNWRYVLLFRFDRSSDSWKVEEEVAIQVVKTTLVAWARHLQPF